MCLCVYVCWGVGGGGEAYVCEWVDVCVLMYELILML